MTKGASRAITSSRWLMPLFSLGLGIVVFVTLIVAWLVATARGQNGHPYDWLLAISGLSYLLAIAFFRWRG